MHQFSVCLVVPYSNLCHYKEYLDALYPLIKPWDMFFGDRPATTCPIWVKIVWLFLLRRHFDPTHYLTVVKGFTNSGCLKTRKAQNSFLGDWLAMTYPVIEDGYVFLCGGDLEAILLYAIMKTVLTECHRQSAVIRMLEGFYASV